MFSSGQYMQQWKSLTLHLVYGQAAAWLEVRKYKLGHSRDWEKNTYWLGRWMLTAQDSPIAYWL